MTTTVEILAEGLSKPNLPNAPEFHIDYSTRSGVLLRTPAIHISHHGGKYYDRHLSMVAFCAVLSSWLGQYVNSRLITGISSHRRCRNTYHAYVECNPRENLFEYQCFPSCVVVVCVECEHYQITNALVSSTLCFRSLNTALQFDVLDADDSSSHDFGLQTCPVSQIYSCHKNKINDVTTIKNDPRFLLLENLEPLEFQ